MGNLNRIVAKQIAKNNGKVKMIHGKIISNLLPDIEWIKWLSYEPEFEKKRIEYLASKKIPEISCEELEEVTRYI